LHDKNGIGPVKAGAIYSQKLLWREKMEEETKVEPADPVSHGHYNGDGGGAA